MVPTVRSAESTQRAATMITSFVLKTENKKLTKGETCDILVPFLNGLSILCFPESIVKHIHRPLNKQISAIVHGIY